MVKVEHITKDWKEAGSFPAQINLYGFWDEHSFLTKSGDLGIMLKSAASTMRVWTTQAAITW